MRTDTNVVAIGDKKYIFSQLEISSDFSYQRIIFMIITLENYTLLLFVMVNVNSNVSFHIADRTFTHNRINSRNGAKVKL